MKHRLIHHTQSAVIVLLISLFTIQPIYGQTVIKDIKKNPNKTAIQFTVNKGFLPLYQDKTFRSQETITRDELAFILYKLNQNIRPTPPANTPFGIQSATLKTLLAQLESQIQDHTQSISRLNTEQQTLHHDLTATNESLTLELAQTKQELAQQQTWLWIAIGTVGLLTLSK